MARNVEKQIQIGKDIISDNPRMALDVNELKQLLEPVKGTGSLDELWELVGRAFYMGVAIGSRTK